MECIKNCFWSSRPDPDQKWPVFTCWLTRLTCPFCHQVYHLQGGILKYLEEVPKTESLWEGECFVFDKRVSVKHGLVPGNFKLCYGCKKPVSDADMESPEWEYGVTCPYCYASKSEEEKERARARQRQFEEWGVIGGPDKGRRPAKTTNTNNSDDIQMSRSMWGQKPTIPGKNPFLLATNHYS